MVHEKTEECDKRLLKKLIGVRTKKSQVRSKNG